MTIERTLIKNAKIVEPGRVVRSGSLLMEAGRISAIDPADETLQNDYQLCEAAGRLLTPGLVDLHTHGIHQYVYELGPENLLGGSAVLPAYGTTCVLPTLYTKMRRATLAELEQLAEALETVTGARMPGFHLEGPFLAISGAGASTQAGDLVLLDELLAASGGRVLAMSVSPETANILPIIEKLREQNVAVFLTHTGATCEETTAAIDAGARHATHFYDVFPLPPETDAGVRPVGAVESLLADSRCTVDFICDGVHVHPMAVRAALAAKSWQGVIAITDSNIGAGLAAGTYPTPMGYSVEVDAEDAARIADSGHPLRGSLAGSSLTMDRAVANLFHWLDLPAEQVWALATVNPAQCVGLSNKGRIEVGADADLVLWEPIDAKLRAAQTWVSGHCVYNAETDDIRNNADQRVQHE